MTKRFGKGMFFIGMAFTFSLGLAQAQDAKSKLNLTLEQALEIALSENPTIKMADEIGRAHV